MIRFVRGGSFVHIDLFCFQLVDSPARSSGTPEPEGVFSAYPRIYFNIGVFDIVKANHAP